MITKYYLNTGTHGRTSLKFTKTATLNFCESVVQQRLLVNQEILRLSRLTQLVTNSIRNVESIEPVGIRLLNFLGFFNT